MVQEPEATDAARQEAKALGVNLDEVQGTGQEGKVTVNDVRQNASDDSGTKKVTLDPSFGIGEFVVEDGEGNRQVFLSGQETPVGSLDGLPKDDEGNLAFPLVEVKDGDK